VAAPEVPVVLEGKSAAAPVIGCTERLMRIKKEGMTEEQFLEIEKQAALKPKNLEEDK